MRRILTMAAAIVAMIAVAADKPANDKSLTLVVMDPLALPLSCPCVKGYAQRDYDKLGDHLAKKLGRPVKVAFSESLVSALKTRTDGQADIVIGKYSVVNFDAKRAAMKFTPVANLTGKDGKTTQTGLVVVLDQDKAKSIEDLKDYKILYGNEEADEKHAAVMKIFKAHQFVIPEKPTTCAACDEGALKLMEMVKGGEKGAAVISSYAKPLLEGCGTIPKGALRVIAETDPVPFVVAFTNDSLSADVKDGIVKALMAVADDVDLSKALETKNGFLKHGPKKKVTSNNTWPGWRGENRDGRVASLPDRLPTKPLWRKPLPSQGLGGIAATDKVVIVSSRDLNDSADLWRCLDPANGNTLWSLRYPAPGRLDYGQSPRATPIIHDGIAYCLGAFGQLHAVDIATGKVVWKRDSKADFASTVDKLPWGLCGSPLIVGDKLIYYPGGPKSALVALNLKTGAVIWKVAGDLPSYGSFIVANLGGVEQLIGHDETTLGSWRVDNGQRLWTLKPARPKDFNVPTPIVSNGQLIVTTENNGTRIYKFGPDGQINAEPLAVYAELCPDAHSPVLSNGRLFGVHHGLHCLSLSSGLQPIWKAADDNFKNYASLIATDNRLLVVCENAEAMIVDTTADHFKLLDRRRLMEDEEGLYAHPAVAGGRLFLRTSDAIVCFDWPASP